MRVKIKAVWPSMMDLSPPGPQGGVRRDSGEGRFDPGMGPSSGRGAVPTTGNGSKTTTSVTIPMAVGKVGVDENNRPKYRMVSWKLLNLLIDSLNPMDILAMLMPVCWRLASFKYKGI